MPCASARALWARTNASAGSVPGSLSASSAQARNRSPRCSAVWHLDTPMPVSIALQARGRRPSNDTWSVSYGKTLCEASRRSPLQSDSIVEASRVPRTS